ncbi:hypothetical protein ACQP1G_25770 [Nocardia sp. CA-107356]|uniref:hypothetical protein n=1 Tax=Nocardia sp. CA-107356 TaxID=3239972 RepID=UPI003D90EB77
MSTALEFIGEPFDSVMWLESRKPENMLSPLPSEASVLARVRTALVVAHVSALRAQAALQLRPLAGTWCPAGSDALTPNCDEAVSKPLAQSAADASIWKQEMPVYELSDLTVELREKDAQPW